MKSYTRSSLVLSMLLPVCAMAFTIAPSSLLQPTTRPLSMLALAAKNKKSRRSTGGEGFGKTAPSSTTSFEDSDDVAVDTTNEISTPRALQSIDMTANTKAAAPLKLDPNLSDEERSEQILRQKFGLTSYAEQQGDIKQMLADSAKKEEREKLRNWDKLWPEDKDLFAILPPDVLRGIDSFLKLGLGVCTVLFISAGVFITIEAGSKATGYELPLGLEEFVVNVVQPNFTPGLLVLLGFSVGLGVFSAAQLSSAGSTYREDP